MKLKHLLELIEEGETLTCEFKLKFSSHEKIAKEMIAFANTRGGYIIFGVDDNKNIIGLENEKAETELIIDTIENYCEPPLNYKIDYIEFKGQEVIVVEIIESLEKPHRLQDYQNDFNINTAQVFVRVKDKSVQASKEMIRIMKADTSASNLKKYIIGETEKKVFDFLNIYERISVKDLSNLCNISYRRASRTLVKMVRANLLLIHTKDNGEEFFTSL